MMSGQRSATRRACRCLFAFVLLSLAGLAHAPAQNPGGGSGPSVPTDQISCSIMASGAPGSGGMTQSMTWTTTGSNSSAYMYLYRLVNGSWYMDNAGDPIADVFIPTAGSGSTQASRSGSSGGTYKVAAEIRYVGLAVATHESGSVVAP